MNILHVTIIAGALLPAGQLSAQSPQKHPVRISAPGFRPDQVAPAPPPEPQEQLSQPVKTKSETEPVAEAAAEPGPALEQGGSLDLMCFGAGSANKLAMSSAWGWSAFGSASALAMSERSQGFDDQVSLRMRSSDGRIRMPRAMLPAIRGGEDGWFKLRDVRVKPNEITASIAVNIANNPKLRLDRYSGAISISGKAGDYSGRCRKFDPEKMDRQF